jgi:hypothetical protein
LSAEDVAAAALDAIEKTIHNISYSLSFGVSMPLNNSSCMVAPNARSFSAFNIAAYFDPLLKKGKEKLA